jgi:2TM domain
MVEEDRRELALERLEAKRNLTRTAVAFAAVSLLLVIIWLVAGQGFFWPVFPIAGLVVALGMQAFGIWGQKPISERDVEREMERSEDSG